MTTYRPFLKTTRGELDAALSIEGIGTTIQPVWELVPTRSESAEAALMRRLSELSLRVPWRIDARYIERAGASCISVIDAACRAHGVTYIPVIDSNPTPDDMAATAAAVADHRSGLTVRIPSPTGPADVDRTAAMIRALGLRPPQADLVVDCGFIADDVAASQTAGKLLIPTYRALTQRWRSVTVLSGAFPATPFGAPAAKPATTPTMVARHDAALFRQLPFTVDFGDFGVAHALPSPAENDAPPSLRWNRGDDWVVYGQSDIGRMRLPGAQRSSDRITRSGAPTEWAEWSTSHHLATVRQRLDRNAA